MDIQLFIVSEYPKGFGDAPLAFFEDELKKQSKNPHWLNVIYIFIIRKINVL